MPIRRHPVATGASVAKLRALPVDTALIQRLRASFELIRLHDLELGRIFYAKLFETAPHLRPLFKSSLAEQSEKLITTLAAIVRNLDDPDANAALLADLGRRHRAYGVQRGDYDLVIDLLIASMAQLLGLQADPKGLDEWRMALRLISDQMIAAGRDDTTD